MLTFPSSLKVYLSLDPCDMRKGINGINALVVEHLQEDPLNGALYVFSNKKLDRVKILYWDGSGTWLWTKRLEDGRFSWPKGTEIKNGKLSLTPDALRLLLSGIDLKNAARRPWYQREVP